MRLARPGVVAAAIGAALLPIPPAAVERWYSSLAYPAVQRLVTPLSNLLPIALFDVLCCWAVTAFVLLIYRRVRADGWRRGLRRAAGTLLVGAAIAYLAF